MKKSTLIIFFFTFLFYQCKKEDASQSSVDYRANTIFGKVVDKTTGQSIAHARVYLLKAENVILQNPAWITTATQYSDSSGNFSFAAQPNSDTIYQVYCTKDLFFDDGNNQTTLSSNQIGYATQVKLQPMAWLKLHMKNVTPFNKSDEIYILPANGSGSSFVGNNIDTIANFLAYGNTLNRYIITITKNSNERKIDTMFIAKSFDTTLINIFY